MKLTRLDLDRYGPFTGTRLDFRPDADLHIVYGPNEAGKSSALSAITDLLYGFEPRSPANFRHRYEDLKVGAELQQADGSALRFWRRKRSGGSGAGLGMAIVQRVAQANGGSIALRSEEGHGTAFIVRLPLASIPKPAQNKA